MMTNQNEIQEKAKKSWEGKGLTEGGLAVIGRWIEMLASVGPRFSEYQKFAVCTSDVRGSLINLQNTIKMIEEKGGK